MSLSRFTLYLNFKYSYVIYLDRLYAPNVITRHNRVSFPNLLTFRYIGTKIRILRRVKRPLETLTIEKIRAAHAARRDEIRRRLLEFERIWADGSDADLWREMVFCFFTGGCSAKMGLRSIEAVGSLLMAGTQPELAAALRGVHRYPNARSRYIVASREYLQAHCGMRLRDRLAGFEDPLARRDWLATDRDVKGLGFKEASHFLRNVGFKGYAILDKHVLNCLFEIGVIDDPNPPGTRDRYLRTEMALVEFSARLSIDPDEMDLVLWSLRTGEILK
jgi:N-glycosylase/DNA lyase